MSINRHVKLIVTLLGGLIVIYLLGIFIFALLDKNKKISSLFKKSNTSTILDTSICNKYKAETKTLDCGYIEERTSTSITNEYKMIYEFVVGRITKIKQENDRVLVTFKTKIKGAQTIEQQLSFPMDDKGMIRLDKKLTGNVLRDNDEEHLIIPVVEIEKYIKLGEEVVVNFAILDINDANLFQKTPEYVQLSKTEFYRCRQETFLFVQYIKQGLQLDFDNFTQLKERTGCLPVVNRLIYI